MRNISQKDDRKNRFAKIMILFLAPLIALLFLNFRQVYSRWAVWSETNRLTELAESAPDGYQNPAPLEDRFKNISFLILVSALAISGLFAMKNNHKKGCHNEN